MTTAVELDRLISDYARAHKMRLEELDVRLRRFKGHDTAWALLRIESDGITSLFASPSSTSLAILIHDSTRAQIEKRKEEKKQRRQNKSGQNE